MNIFLLFFIEWILSFLVLIGINYILMKLFNKKFNPITSVVFTFLVSMIFAFIVSPYVLSFSYPAIIYLPIILVLLIINLILLSKKD